MPSGFRRVLVSVAVCMIAAVAATSAEGGYYSGVGGACVGNGQAYVSGYSGWQVNTVDVAYFCPTSQGYSFPCLYYIRPDGTDYPHTCFHFDGVENPPPYSETFVDPRDISYGRAVCKNSGPDNTYFNYCYAG